MCASDSPLQAGFAAVDITPSVGPDDPPVWLAGYGWGRRATDIHDPIFARTLVLSDGRRRLAIVSVDLIGLQYPEVVRVREALPDIDYVVVSSTHNHEGPDTIGIWGPTPVQRGVDDDYLQQAVDRIVASVRQAASRMRNVEASYGTASDDALLGDSRLPVVKDGVLRVVRFESPDSDRLAGLLVQWNCHPESLGSRNSSLTADFCHPAVAKLKAIHQCPIVYVTGAVGGLMAPPEGEFRGEDGRILREGEFEYARAYGEAVAELARQATLSAQPLRLVPFQVSSQVISLPIENPLYRTARMLGVLRRASVEWTGDFHDLKPVTRLLEKAEFGARTEVALIRMGELSIACIPGELYPELVYGQFPDPPEPNVDFPDAPLEPTVQQLMPTDRWMLFGLANDEVGYIIPRRQWDQQPPFAYGRSKPQYGEINSCSSSAAPIIMQALSECVRAAQP